jgi:hypothetical protein
MEKFQQRIFKNIPVNKFLFIAMGLCILGDALHITYAREVWLTKDAFHVLFLRMVMSQGVDPRDIPQNDLMEGSSVLFNTLWLCLFGVIFFNAIFYFLFYKLKRSGVLYTKFIVFFSLILTTISFLKEMLSLDVWMLLSFFHIILYTFVWLGMKYYPEIKNAEQRSATPQDAPTLESSSENQTEASPPQQSE